MNKDKKPLISIITVCFNSEKTIERTIESVLNQDFDNYEYLIIDGGSTDATMEIVKKYETDFAGKLKYISEKDNGIYDAMNKGIKMSNGDIIGIINSDDFYETGAFTNVAKQYDNNIKYQVIYGMFRVVNEDGSEHSIKFQNASMLGHLSLPHPSSFITAAAYEKYGLYDESYRIAADFDLFLRLNEIKDVKFVPLYKIIANFSLGGVSTDSKHYFNCELETLSIKHKYNVISKKELNRAKLKLKIKRLIGSI